MYSNPKPNHRDTYISAPNPLILASDSEHETPTHDPIRKQQCTNNSPACAGGDGLVGSLAGAAGAGLGDAAFFFSAAAMRWEGSSLSTSTRRSNWFLVPMAAPPLLASTSQITGKNQSDASIRNLEQPRRRRDRHGWMGQSQSARKVV